MIAFFRENPITLILLIIGGFFLFMTYGALITSKRTGHYVSGVPLVGGLFIFLAFIISSKKILCLLCFLDYGFYALPYSILYSSKLVRLQKTFEQTVTSMGYTAAPPVSDEKLIITYPFGEKTHWNIMSPNNAYTVPDSGVVCMLCRDTTGKEFIAVQKYKPKSDICFVPFDRNGTELVDGISIKTAKKP